MHDKNVETDPTWLSVAPSLRLHCLRRRLFFFFFFFCYSKAVDQHIAYHKTAIILKSGTHENIYMKKIFTYVLSFNKGDIYFRSITVLTRKQTNLSKQ